MMFDRNDAQVDDVESTGSETTEAEPRFRGNRADKDAFAKRLGNLIHGRGIRQAELARRSELAPYLISNYVLGRALPGKVNLIKIAKALNVAPGDLLPAPGDRDVAVIDSPISLVVNHDDPTMALLRVNMTVRTDVGSEIIKLLLKSRSE